MRNKLPEVRKWSQGVIFLVGGLNVTQVSVVKIKNEVIFSFSEMKHY